MSIAVALVATLALAGPSLAVVPLIQISSDTYTNVQSFHATQVEPDTFAVGSTIVSAFQTGRIFSGGAAVIGWATSTDAGTTWTHGSLPAITKFEGDGPYDAVSDPSVAYDAAHGVWLISTLGVLDDDPFNFGAAVLVSRSTDGVSWGNPVSVMNIGNIDKNWTVCDNTVTSPFYGNCYTQADVATDGRIKMSTSSDGGLTWSAAVNTAGSGYGSGGQPLVQPNGTVVVPISGVFQGTGMQAYRSVDGGATWSAPFTFSSQLRHDPDGDLRGFGWPSAEIDAAGRVYVVWEDCRFRPRCSARSTARSANDLVMSTSTDGLSWSPVTRIPIDRIRSKAEAFIPGLAVDASTSGSTARLALAFYYYENAQCRSRCQLNVGYVSSADGGLTWSAKTQLAGPMDIAWVVNTSQGRMVGDYISTSFAGGTAHPVFSVAAAPSGGAAFDQAMYTPTVGLGAGASGTP